MKRFAAVPALAATSLTLLAGGTADARAYSNCTKLNKAYPHGVGKSGARDSTSGKPVTNFERNTRVYNDNRARDRDLDGIACEKR